MPVTQSRRLRPLLSLTASLLLALSAGTAAFFLQSPQYQSTGTIHVRPMTNPLYGEPKPFPMYDSTIRTAMEVLTSERCLNIAVESYPWRDRAPTPTETQSFNRHLSVARDAEFIRISFTSSTPKNASAGVAAITESYRQLMLELDPDNATKRTKMLEALKAGYEADLADHRKRMADVAFPYTADSLQGRYTYRLQESLHAESELQASKIELEAWKIANPPTDSPPANNANVALLEAKVLLNEARVKSIASETESLETKLKSVDRLKHDMSFTQEWLDKTRQQLEEQRLNNNRSGQILILSNGDTPIPLYTRRLTIASLTAAAAFLLSLPLTLLLLRRKPTPT